MLAFTYPCAYTDPEIMVCTWFGEFYSCCCLPPLLNLPAAFSQPRTNHYFGLCTIAMSKIVKKLRIEGVPDPSELSLNERGARHDAMYTMESAKSTDAAHSTKSPAKRRSYSYFTLRGDGDDEDDREGGTGQRGRQGGRPAGRGP